MNAVRDANTIKLWPSTERGQKYRPVPLSSIIRVERAFDATSENEETKETRSFVSDKKKRRRRSAVRIPHSGRAGYLLQGGGNPFLLVPEWKWERKRNCRWIAKDTCMQSVLRLVQQNGARQESRLKKDPPTYRQEYEDPPIPVNHDSQKPSHLHISVVVVSEIALHQDSGAAVLSPSGGAFLLNLKWAHQTH